MGEMEAERPEWFLEKFETMEDQARAYPEAEKEMSRMRAEMDRERDQFQNALQNLEALRPDDTYQQPPQQVYNPEQDPLLQQYQQALDMGDARALLAINLELQKQVTQQTIQEQMKDLQGTMQRGQEVDREHAITLATERVSRQHDDWEELAPEVGRFLQQNSELIPTVSSVEAYERAIGQAARVVKAEKYMAESQRNESTRQQKIASQGLTGESSRFPPQEQLDKEWQAVKAAQLTGYRGILGG